MELLYGCAMLTVGFLGGLYSGLFWPTEKPGPQEWEVHIGPAMRRTENYAYDYNTDEERTTPVEGELAVSLRRGKQWQPYGSLLLESADFEENLRAMVSAAEDRCTTLNAVYDEVGHA